VISARRVEVVVAVVVGGRFGLSAGVWLRFFFVGRRRVQTDVISRDCFHEVGEKGKNLRLEKCRKMNQNKSRLVLVSFYFIFNFFFFFVFTVPRSRLESTALRHDIRRRSIALIGVKCHVKSSSDDSTRKKKPK
jgi:hypothetical protein